MSEQNDSVVELATGHSLDLRRPIPTSGTDLSRPDLSRPGAVSAPQLAKSTPRAPVNVFTPRKVIAGIKRYWVIALPVAAATAVGGYVAAQKFLGAPTFTVRTQLHVAQNRPMLLYDTPEGRTDFSTYQRNQIASLRSRRVLQHAIDKLADKKLSLLVGNPDPITWLETAIQADFTLAPEHLRITLKGSNPDELLLLLTAVRESYLSICVNTEQNARKERLEDLTTLRNDETTKRDQKWKQVYDLAEKETNTRDPNMVKAARDDAYGLKQQLIALYRNVKATIRQAELTAPINLMPNGGAKPEDPATEQLQEAFDRDAVLIAEAGKLDALDAYLKNRRATLVRYQDDDGYQAKQAERTEVQRRIDDRRAAITKAFRPTPRNPIAPVGGEQPHTAESLKRMEEYAAEIEKQIKEEAGKAERLTQSLLKIEAIREEATRKETRVKSLTEQIEGLEVEQKAPERTTLLEEAVISQAPNPDKHFKMSLGAAGGGFVAAFLAVGLLSARRNRVESPADVVGVSRLVGTLPDVGQAARETLTPPSAAADLDQFYRLGDAVDTTRCLVLPRSGPRGHVLLVTSATAGEGKTTVSGHLAGRLARCGYRTLLVDANVRRPGTAAYLPPANTVGYADVLCGFATLDQAVQPGPMVGLDLLTAGAVDPHVVNEYLDRHLPSLLGELRDRYDVVILDGPAVLDAPEAVITARWVNGVLLTTRCNVSKVKDLKAAVERMKAVNAPVSGVVLSGAGTGSQSN
jgi:polysaccharide biosynthesis transport protein